MADRDDEGWHVPQRLPIAVAAATVMLIVALLLVAAREYQGLRFAHRGAVNTFPAPGIETFAHDGVEDPHRPAASAARDPAIERAKHAVVAQGLAGWSSR